MFSLKRIFIMTALVIVPAAVFSQTTPSFDLDTYKLFLSSHQTMSSDQLKAFRPGGTFARTSRTDFDAALYADTIQMKYQLTPGERSLIGKNGFMVTERLKHQSFADAFYGIYQRDLPVFVSTDAILHAVHMSYDAMLRDTEQRMLIAKLDTLLKKLQGTLPGLSSKYALEPAMRQSLLDLDLYLTVPRKLMKPAAAPVFAESQSAVTDMMDLIAHEQASEYPLFASTPRMMDFSQFIVRGHYTQSPELGTYFKAMMWLGRTEIYLLSPVSADDLPTETDMQRQVIDAALIKEAADASDAWPLIEEIDGVLRFFVGESDNVTLPDVSTLMDAADASDAGELLNATRWKAFQDTLALKPFAFQRILSQILSSDPLDPTQIRPASAFLLFGQRFVIDSYVTGSVVFDKIKFEGKKVWRPLPSSLDVLFALGNNSAAQLLETELSQYHYAPNLAAVRYLIDAYEKDFWTGTLYNNWLGTIRALNPPAGRDSLPRFMQTAAWWQEKMTTQLASWTELRHDNLLYAKPSYTGRPVCSYPESYVEPVPEFFAALTEFASIAEQKFRQFNIPQGSMISDYWRMMKGYAEQLGGIAQKELSKTPLTESERSWLRTMLFESSGCTGTGFSGWYPAMFYTPKGESTPDFVVADIHTCPANASGTLVGWVMHVGTGPVNLGVFTAELPDGRFCAFVGPVMSYYERVTSNFDRLTDERWKTEYMTLPSARPSFVNLYCADGSGNERAEGPMLLTGVIDRDKENVAVPTSLELGQNYPNPFNGMTVISFSIPHNLAGSPVDLAVYDVQGRKVKQLVHQPMGEGSYSVRWDGTSDHGTGASSGIYFYHLTAGMKHLAGKMCFIK